MSNYKRILLKISGESLMGNKQCSHDIDFIKRIASDIKEIVSKGISLCIVVGGGNIYRGEQAAALGIERVTADYMGMLGTVINALAIQSILEDMEVSTRVMSAIPMNTICEPYIRRKADRHLEKNRVVIFASGSGNPFFTTDTAAVLRAIEMNCDVLMKATKTDGVYTADPAKDSAAKRLQSITYQRVLEENLGVMDMAAIALARENKLPILVFSINESSQLIEIVNGGGKYTKIF